MEIVITSPSLDTATNVSGISSVAAMIIRYDRTNTYIHFQIGKPDEARRGVRWALALLRMYGKWCGVALRQRKRILHFNMALDRLSLIRDIPMILIARGLGRRIVVHVHGGKLLSRLPSSKWLGWVVRGCLLGCHATIVLGDREARIFGQLSGKANVVALPNCVDLEQARVAVRHFAAAEPIALLFLGRIAPGKGVDTICDALAILCERGCPMTFVLAGAGPESERYVSRLAAIPGLAVRFAGVVSGAEKAALLRNSDVFLLPSHFEGLPMALLESMAFGVVPITTDVGSIGEVITSGSNGLLLRSRCAVELADAIELLAFDVVMRERLSVAAQHSIFERHDPSRYVERLNEIYRHE